MLDKILVPLDGSTLAERALPYAERIARATSGGITLLHDLAGIHHHDPLGGLGNDAHVVRDEHEGHAALALQRQ